MKGLLLASALMVLAATGADAQRRPAGQGPRNVISSGGGPSAPIGSVGTVGDGRIGRGDGRKLVGDVWIVEDNDVEVVEVPVEKAAAAAPAEPAKKEEEEKPREPYVVGNSYNSLPGGCMKMLQDGASYYLCNGDWYQATGGGQYKAVKAP